MKSKQVNQKNEKSQKFNLEKQEVLTLDTMRKIYGGNLNPINTQTVITTTGTILDGTF
jgi:hypothetical protein